MPKRIQRKRTKGWRMPKGAVYVGRPTKWGNPFVLASFYRDWLDSPHRSPHLSEQKSAEMDRQRELILMSIEELRGKDLACWCPLTSPCHADILLELANK